MMQMLDAVIFQINTSELLPSGVTLRRNEGTVQITWSGRISEAFHASILDDLDAPDMRDFSAAIYVLLSDLQDSISEELRVPWPPGALLPRVDVTSESGLIRFCYEATTREWTWSGSLDTE